MPASDIVIKGAREHNLRDVDLILPRNQLICLTGVSGSGKSSLAFDTVYAEGQRRYVESLSSFARQFLGQMPKPDVDLISGLSPSISISQKSSGKNPRSTVGTITEIYDYLRVLFARVGTGYCPRCNNEITAQTTDQIIGTILQMEKGTGFAVLAPVIRGQKGEHKDLFGDLQKRGYVRVRVDGEIVLLGSEIELDRQMRHDIEVVVDRLKVESSVRGRLSEAVESALKIGDGSLIVAIDNEGVKEKKKKSDAKPDDSEKLKKRGKNSIEGDRIFSVDYACSPCGISFQPPTPQLFSFNSPQGMCSECGGMGHLYSFDPELLIPDPKKSFKKGCFEILGTWTDLGRWRRHIYEGLAETIERQWELPETTLLETPWEDLSKRLQDVLLFGTGELHITFTWRGGQSPMKYGGKFEGIIPELNGRYRNAKSAPKRRQLEAFMNTILCGACEGERLNRQARNIKLTTNSKQFKDDPVRSLPQICNLAVSDAREFFSGLTLDATGKLIASDALKEIRNRLGFLLNVGLEYLSLNRTAPTLSGGESQRIRLASQIGSGLVGVLYILDEPSIGLHARDNDRLIETLKHLRDQGNTVLVVEHDEDTMRASDYMIDFGPGPGVRGGHVVAEGPPSKVAKVKESVTGQFLAGQLTIDVPDERRKPDPERQIRILGARQNNLKNVDASIPLGTFCCVTGVSGSGKSSLVNDILRESLFEDLNRGIGEPGLHDSIEGVDLLDKLIAIDQSPIGRTPRSNPGTYIKVFDEIRKLFAQLPESKRRGFAPGRFSFNVKAGRCEACEGNGSNKLEMDFLADVWVTCPICEGKRFDRETLQVKFKDYSIADVLEMDIRKGMEVFENIPKVYNKLTTLAAVGLDYLQIGQPSPTLSGGEAQRIKLARELTKKSTGKTLYLLDEPTTGLHFADIQMLLKVLQNFVEQGNTVLVVEHNLDVIKTADWIIDIGPEGGAMGGRIVGQGTPETIAGIKESYTGRALAKTLGIDTTKEEKTVAADTKKKPLELATHVDVRGAAQHNLRKVDAAIERDKMTVFCGPSGSGKSSLAMDTIYAEGQRRYVESLSSYARQFVNQMPKPKLDHIEGLSPAIAIEQKNFGSTSRSTVGTVTEVYDYLRILFSRLGTPYCPDCDRKIGTQTLDQVVDRVMDHDEGQKLLLMAPVSLDGSQNWPALFDEVRAAGFIRVRVDGTTYGIDEVPSIDKRKRHEVDVVVDRIMISQKSHSRIADSVESALSLGKGVIRLAYPNDKVDEKRWRVVRHSQHLACDKCSRSFEMLSPHNFSFNSTLGWCKECEGIGTQIGANPEILLNGEHLSLRDNAVNIWPNSNEKLAKAMLKALSEQAGLPVDTPFDQLDSRARRLVFYGTSDRWFTASVPGSKKDFTLPPDGFEFRFQYHGLYPALADTSKLSAGLRARLQNLIDTVECGVCGGSRLRDDAAAMRFKDHSIDGLCRMPLGVLQKEVAGWKMNTREKKIAGEIIREVTNRIDFLNDVGLTYITLSRAAASLSNGESQRIRLAGQLGSGLCGVLYVLDEPTIGLHPRDNTRLINALHRLRDLGNTLLVVEHDREVISEADAICDFGPGAGSQGGQIVAVGDPESIKKRRGSVTGPYLKGKRAIPIPNNRRPAFASEAEKKAAKKAKKTPIEARSLSIIGARQNNLKGIDVHIPLQTLTAVTGPSGCGKSSLINEVLYNSLASRLHRASAKPGKHETIRGIEYIDKVIRVDQQPIGNTPTSNPATYTGAFDLIRTLFAQLPESKLRGFTQRRFSFNVPGGRCEKCAGNGQICIEMHFLPDVWVKCEACDGKRYTEETLGVKFHGQSINDVLEMTCGNAVKLFANVPKVARILQTLCDVGLDYLTLGQSAPTLSGGEAQRVKLASELSRPDTGNTLYLLDEPTTGLHFDDLAKLLKVLHRLVDLGNTVVLIEHNTDVIKSADWVIDLGPEAGRDGGELVFAGTPEDLVAHATSVEKANKPKAKTAKSKPTKKKVAKASPGMTSYTGLAMVEMLEAGPYKKRPTYKPTPLPSVKEEQLDLADIGSGTKMPWEADGRTWHTKTRVGRSGKAVKWSGDLLAKVVDYIEANGQWSDTDWNSRSVVEIAAKKKNTGWFFHALTGETWLLKLKFRCRKGTFKRNDLQQKINLPTANQMDELPIYGNQPRVKLSNQRGIWQEVEIHAHSLEEIDIPEFWEILDTAIASFQQKEERIEQKIDDHMPWTKLGQKWHFMRKGFAPGKKVKWDVEVLEEIYELLQRVAPEGQFLWNNKQVVHVFVPDQKEPWASIQTKKVDSVWLQLTGPAGQVPLGRIAEIGQEPVVKVLDDEREAVRLTFKTIDEVQSGDLEEFLIEHRGLLSV